jgi:hypothetical protein
VTTGADAGSQIDAAALWRVIGRLEGNIASLQGGQREFRADLQAGLQEVNRRVDRLFYAILALGGALFAAIFASRFIGD